MHLPVLKALVAVIAASVVALGVALEPAARKPQHVHRSAATSQTSSLEKDGLEFIGQIAAANVKPDATLKESWTDDVTAVAHSLGLTDRALADQLSAGRPVGRPFRVYPVRQRVQAADLMPGGQRCVGDV